MLRSRTRPTAIEQVQTRFAQWRQTKQGRARIPDQLWTAAIQVARRDGVNRTATALRLDGGKLKQRMAAGAVPAEAPLATFVELTPAPSSVLPECTIELEGRHGNLRIRCKGTTAAELAGLSRALWEMGC